MPSASGPRRLASTRCRTPWRATRCRATRPPSTPAPETRTVPSGPNTGGQVRRLSRRGRGAGRESLVPRTATCGSPHASTEPSTDSTPSPDAGSRSSRTIRSGFSDWADTHQAPHRRRGRVGHRRRHRRAPRRGSRPPAATPPARRPATPAARPARERSTRARCRRRRPPGPPPPAAPRSAPPGRRRSATATHDGDGSARTVGSSVQSTWNSASRWSAAVRSWSVETGRSTSEADRQHRATGPVGRLERHGVRYRQAPVAPGAPAAPAACSATPVPVQRLPPARPGHPRRRAAPGAAAASSSAGWTPKPPASVRCSSGRATSANTSSPRRHTARTPWNAGP